MMSTTIMPKWLQNLDKEDLVFIKRFLLASGSLKEVARQYEVTYPTVRTRLNKLIEKIKLSDNDEDDAYISLIKRLVIDEQLEFDGAKILIDEYKKMKGDSVWIF